MRERRNWLATVVYIGLALTLALSFALPAATANCASAAPAKLSEWDDVSTPSKTDKVIVPESDILDFDMGPDGEVIYAVVRVTNNVDFPPADYPGDTALFKSEDAGRTWDDITDEVIEEGLNAFSLVAVAPDDADYVIVAGANMVIGSNDGGDDFSDTVFPTIAAKIRCLDVSPERDDNYNIAVGTDGGDVYRYESGGYYGSSWKNVTTGVNAYAGWLPSTWVTSVAFSPCFDGDDAILAITATATDTYQQSGLWGTTKKWNAAAGGAFPAAVKIVDAPPLAAFGHTGIALPDDFVAYDSGLRYNWVYVNYDVNNSADAPASFKNALNAIGEPQIGEVFRIKGKSVDYAGIRCERYKSGRNYPLMASIDMTGEIEDGNLMVGLMGKAEGVNGEPTACCAGIQVYRTSEWPIHLYYPQWSSAKKPPTGQGNALVAYTPDGTKAYAATSGNPSVPTPPDESAFSMSEVEEVGKYWNQLSLIDTNVDYLSDMAVNPACGTIWLFSVNGAGCGCDSVWSSTDEGASYMRVWCKDLAGVPEIGLIRTAPEEEEEVITVYLVDRGTKTIYWNDDSGLTKWTAHTAAPLADIMDLAVEAEDTIYPVDSAGEVSMSDKHGAPGSWSSAEDAKLATGEAGHTIAALDGYVLVGGDDGSVGYSEDSADTFSRLGTKYELGVGGLIHVAFDTYFKTNDIVYAAVTGGDQRVWRWVINDSTSWKDLKTTSQDYYGIVLNGDNPMTNATTGGVLYALYVDGMARCLSPATSPSASKWDYLTNGVPAGTTFIAEPNALKVCGGSSFLWAIDTSGYDLAEGKDNVFVYEDQVSLNNPPQLSNPSVQPISGTPSTNFYYYVRYYDSDGDSPSARYVYVHGSFCLMSLYSGLASNGVYRYGPKNLAIGSHSYYFYFSDGKGGTARLPTSGSYSGPTVSPEVTLESIDATPDSVSLSVGETQAITVTAVYSDASTADVTATSTYSSDAEAVATVSAAGVITGVAAGSAIITVSYTEGGVTNTDTVWVTVAVGPNHPPQLSNPSVQPPNGIPSTNFYYYVRYYDSDGDSPSKAQVCIDNSICYSPMKLYSGTASNGIYRYGPISLSVGSHNYHFYFSDGKGGTARLPTSGSYSGPTVVIGAAHAERDLPGSVEPGANFDVSITASDYGTFGQVVETLPAGFTYVSSSLPAGQVTVTGNVVKFTLLGETSFTYTVTAATTAGTYTFSGIIKDMDLVEFAVTGDTVIPLGWDPWSYDADGDGEISKGEAIDAVQDYFNGVITKLQAIEVVTLYFG